MNTHERTLPTAIVALIVIAMAIAAIALASDLGVLSSREAQAGHVQPELLPGPNAGIKCSDLEGTGQTWIELKFEGGDLKNGSLTEGALTVTISNLTADTFDWSSNIGVDAVFVKGGNQGSNLYVYDPPTESTGDDNLGIPNPSNNSISHISFCFDEEPSLAVTKVCVDAATPGDPIDFSGTVTNDGTMDLVDVTVTDDHAGQVLSPVTLDAGESVNYNGSYAPTESPSTNVVTASGSVIENGTVSATASATCVVNTNPSITVTKACVDASAPGEPITFSGTVTNDGNVGLVDVTVTDDHAGQVLSPITLNMGESVNYSGSYTPTVSPSTNEVTAVGTESLFEVSGATVTATADATCLVPPTTTTTTPTPTVLGATPTPTPAAVLGEVQGPTSLPDTGSTPAGGDSNNLALLLLGIGGLAILSGTGTLVAVVARRRR